MADKKASAESAASALDGTEYWAGVQSAADAKITALQVYNYVLAQSTNLTEWNTLNPSPNGGSLVTAADYAAMRTLLGLVIGTNVQAYDADLDTWATVTPSANGKSLVAAANYNAMRTLLGLPIRIRKTVIENRNTTTTLTADTDLQISLTAGTWNIVVEGSYTIANANMDFKFDTNFNGGAATVTSMLHMYSFPGAAASTNLSVKASATFNDTRSVTSANAGNGYFRIVATIVVSSTGTFEFQWAQNTSDAGTVSVNPGSYLDYTQIV